ncbi:unnamed protein product [Prunus armeniaca]|uniref:Uncharacterized protein n=1 Tax=Prunus armeniaca TaxID=36596 RepID=A0A6J5TG36_PRUAR|nr:unnamed protein product [Prunus armeniaca]
MANSLRIWGLNNPPNLNRKELGCMLNYKRGLNVIDYVDTCYHTQTYFKEYENFILPMNEMELWDRTNIPPCVPPSYSKQPRRPRKARRKEASECNKKANVVTKVQDSLSTKIRRAKPARFVHKENGRERPPLQLEVQMHHQLIQLLYPQYLPILQVYLPLLQLDLPLLHQLKLQLAILFLLRKRPMVVGASDLSKE